MRTKPIARILAILLVALAVTPARADFISGTSTLPTTKRDITPIPPGADPTRYIAAADYNALMNALLSVRAAINNALSFGFTPQASAPTPPLGGSLYQLWVRLSDGHLIYTLSGVDHDLLSGGGGSGTVTSVGLTAPSILTVSGSPVTTSGTIGLALANESALTVLAGPTSGSAAPTFRALTNADLPAIGATASTYCTGSTVAQTVTTDSTGRVVGVTCMTPVTAVGGSLASGQIAYGNAANVVTSSPDLTFNPSSGLALTGGTNVIYGDSTNGLNLYGTVSGGGFVNLSSANATMGSAVGQTTLSGVSDGQTNWNLLSTGQITGKSGLADSSSAVAYILDTLYSYATSGDKLLSIRNHGTEEWSVDGSGNVVAAGSVTTPVLKVSSPTAVGCVGCVDFASIASALAQSTSSGNYTYGTELVPTVSSTLTGIRFYWGGTASTQTAKCSAWAVTGGTRLQTVSVSVHIAGVYTCTFSASVSMTPGSYYIVSVYETTGTNFMASTLSSGIGAPPQVIGSGMLDYAAIYATGDVYPSTTSAGLYPITPVYTIP